VTIPFFYLVALHTQWHRGWLNMQLPRIVLLTLSGKKVPVQPLLFELVSIHSGQNCG
jgi:hypothetical protein